MTKPGGEYETYYSSHPAASFAAQVWTNNAKAAAMCLVFGAFLGLPVLGILWVNMENLAAGIGLMGGADRLDVFLGLILPHGLLELTAVFVAAGTGLRLGWTVIDPGLRTRREALAEQGRAALGMAMGLTVVLFVSGLIEGFVTPPACPPGPASPSAWRPRRPSCSTSTSWAAARPVRARWATWSSPTGRRLSPPLPDVRSSRLSC